MKNRDYRTTLVIVLLYSSVLIGKIYAYLGLALGVTFIFEDQMLWRRWYRALTQRGDPVGPFAWALLISLLYGVAQVIRGYLLEYSVGTALQILVFNLCPIYLFAGIWAGARAPHFVGRFIRFTAWYMVIYSVLYVVILRNMTFSLSSVLHGSNMDLFGRPPSGSTQLLGLLAYEPSLARFWLPILVLSCITIANQERADWLGLMAALALWCGLTRRVSRGFMIAGAIALVLFVAYLVDLRLPALEGRGGELSARETVARMAASISPDMAEEVGASVANSQFYYGTVFWRKHWWAEISDEVSSSVSTRLFGLSYGYPLARLAGPAVEAVGTRSPHNIFYFAYGYSGLVGVAIFLWLQLSVLWLLWRTFKVTGQTYGLTFYCYTILGAFFGNFIETPQGGIYMYLLLGLVIAPGLVQIETDKSVTFNQLRSRPEARLKGALLTSQSF